MTGQQGQEAWTQQYQQQELPYAEDGAGAGGWGGQEEASTTINPGYEGWVWDDSSGWYYDEEVAAAQLAGSGADTGLVNMTVDKTVGSHASIAESGEKNGESDTGSDSGSSGSSSSGDDSGAVGAGEGGGANKRRRNRRRRGPAPRNYPRSKAQRLVDEAEDSVAGARPALLDLSELGMVRVTSRVYDLDWLEGLDLSGNRLMRVSPDLAGMDNLVDLDLRHNRFGSSVDYFMSRRGTFDAKNKQYEGFAHACEGVTGACSDLCGALGVIIHELHPSHPVYSTP